MGERYEFADIWQIPAPVEVTWRMVDDVVAWPRWWSHYRFAECVSSSVRHGAGSRNER